MSKKKETTPTDTPKNGAAPKAVGKAANEAIAYAEQAGVAKAKGEAPEPGKAGEAAPSVVVVPQAEGRPAAKVRPARGRPSPMRRRRPAKTSPR